MPRFFFRKSLRTRLLAGYALVLLISMLIISVYLYVQVEQNFVQTMKSFLRTEFQTTLESLGLGTQALDPASMSNFLSRQTLLGKGPYRLNYALFDEAHHVIARTENFQEDLTVIQTYEPQIEHMDGDIYPPIETIARSNSGRRMFLITGAFHDRSEKFFYLQFGLDESGISENMGTLIAAIFLAVPVVLVLALGGGFFLTRSMLKPIGQLSRAAKELTLSETHRKLPVSGTGDELDELATTFNEVLSRLQESYQRIIRFTADASHELRLPITAIKGEAEVVLSRERGLDEYRKVMTNIIEEFERLSRMVTQLLTLSRADSGQDPLEKESLNLLELIRKLAEFYQPLAEEKNMVISFERQDAVQIQGDAGRLQQLFANLLENAIKYTPSGGQIKISVLGGAAEVRVGISDTGIGIAKGEQEKIFERFYRVDKARRRDEGGVGLGLSIADSIAHTHKGSIHVVSEPGKGSTFTVVLPCNLSI